MIKPLLEPILLSDIANLQEGAGLTRHHRDHLISLSNWIKQHLTMELIFREAFLLKGGG